MEEVPLGREPEGIASRVELDRKSGKSSVTLYVLDSGLCPTRNVDACEDEATDGLGRCRDEEATDVPSRVAIAVAEEGGTVTTFIAGIDRVFVLDTENSDDVSRVCPRRPPAR